MGLYKLYILSKNSSSRANGKSPLYDTGPTCTHGRSLLGSTIRDGRGNSGSEESGTIDVADPVFLELLKDENDGLAVWSSIDKYPFTIR